MRAYVIVDLGFGDSGKGLLTDFLTRHLGAAVVVRYNGGAQAGHNVITPDGRHHTFSQFGSGTFIPGVKTYLSRHVVIHPTALLVEGDILVQKGVQDAFTRIRVSEQALIITPFHQAANHIREIARGENRHGSCGVGVGEAVEDALLNAGDGVLAGDLSNRAKLRLKLQSIREQKRGQLTALFKNQLTEDALAREWGIFEREDVIDNWIVAVSRVGSLGLVAPDSTLQRWLRQAEAVIFEGAQGVLLDADAGFHPYTTWSNCTGENASDIINDLAPGSPVFQIGVTRSYAVRHGPGPLPTETDVLTPVVTEHNQYNQWQGGVRYGWFDAVLARYALSVTGKMDSLVVTHLDVLPRLNAWRYCTGYQEPLDFGQLSGGAMKDTRVPGNLSLDQKARFTETLSKVTPVLEACAPDAETVIQRIETLLGQSVGMVSNGPSAENVNIISPIFSM